MFIILLLIINGILGSNIVLHLFQDQEIRKETAENLMTVLSARDISCTDRVFSQKRHRLCSGKILLDTEGMHTFALSFFDQDYEEKQDGEQIILTSHNKKSISYDVNGIFSGTLKTELPVTATEAKERVDSWLKGQVDDSSYELDSEKSGANYIVRVYRIIDSVRVEEPLQFLFLIDGTVNISGRWTFGTLIETDERTDSRDTIAGSLLGFLNTAKKVSEVYQGEACYCLVSGNGNALKIEPGWHWKTDLGTYLTSTKSDYFIYKE